MTILIAHRGNINGPLPHYENSPAYVQDALDEGFDVEVDLFTRDRDKLFLGHPGDNEYEIDVSFLSTQRLWVHCKDLTSLNIMRYIDMLRPTLQLNYFFHHNDDFTLTSQRYIWTFPGKPVGKFSVAVMPEKSPGWDITPAAGICSDYVAKFLPEVV